MLKTEPQGAPAWSLMRSQMPPDKINLPLPGEDGPNSYDNAYLIFDHAGTGSGRTPLFELTVADLAELNSRKSAARNSVDLNMVGGRPYGLLF